MTTATQFVTQFTGAELRQALFQFTGTEQWYRHPFSNAMLYTDGVKFFAENGGEHGAYWFIDKMALEVCPLLDQKKQYFGSVVMQVNDDETAVITVTDGNDGHIATYHIEYTDMQAGEWRFFMIVEGVHRVMLLPSEY